MMRSILDEDGENRAVRSFLLAYGAGCHKIGDMKSHMELSGWESHPEFVAFKSLHNEHLTKAEAQDWLRHLFAQESTPPAPQEAQPTEQAAPVVNQQLTTQPAEQAGEDSARLDFILVHLSGAKRLDMLIDIIHDEDGFYVGKSKAIAAIDAARAARAQEKGPHHG